MDTSLCSHKYAIAFKGWKPKPVKFGLVKKSMLDAFLTLVDDSSPSVAGVW